MLELFKYFLVDIFVTFNMRFSITLRRIFRISLFKMPLLTYLTLYLAYGGVPFRLNGKIRHFYLEEILQNFGRLKYVGTI